MDNQQCTSYVVLHIQGLGVTARLDKSISSIIDVPVHLKVTASDLLWRVAGSSVADIDIISRPDSRMWA